LNFLKILAWHSGLVYTAAVSGARNQNMKKNVVFLILDPADVYISPDSWTPPANFSSLRPRKCEDIQGLQGNGFGNLTERSPSDFPLDSPLNFEISENKISFKESIKNESK